MKESVFRKKSVDRVNSPEQLNSYIHVTGPSVWLILAGVAVLLIGFLIFALMTKVDGTSLFSFIIN